MDPADDVSMDWVADFYAGTELGQELIRRGRIKGLMDALQEFTQTWPEEGRQAGRTAILARLLEVKFGEQSGRAHLAGHLAALTDAEALRAVETADSLEQLLTTTS